MSKFKLKISLDDEPLVKAKGNRIKDFDNIIDELKHKFEGKRRLK